MKAKKDKKPSSRLRKMTPSEIAELANALPAPPMPHAGQTVSLHIAGGKIFPDDQDDKPRFLVRDTEKALASARGAIRKRRTQWGYIRVDVLEEGFEIPNPDTLDEHEITKAALDDDAALAAALKCFTKHEVIRSCGTCEVPIPPVQLGVITGGYCAMHPQAEIKETTQIFTPTVARLGKTSEGHRIVAVWMGTKPPKEEPEFT